MRVSDETTVTRQDPVQSPDLIFQNKSLANPFGVQPVLGSLLTLPCHWSLLLHNHALGDVPGPGLVSQGPVTK